MLNLNLLAPLQLLLKIYWLGWCLRAILLQGLFEVVIVYLNEMLLGRLIVLNISDSHLTSSFNGEVLYLFKFYRFVALGMRWKIVRQERVPILELLQLERLWTLIATTSLCSRVLGHVLRLQDCSLVALTLKNSLLAFVLFYIWYLRRTTRLCLIASVALRGTRSLNFTAPFSRIVSFFHNVGLGYMVCLLLLILNFIFFFQLLSEGLIVLLSLGIKQNAHVLFQKLAFVNWLWPLASGVK